MNGAINNHAWVTKPLVEVATLQRGHDLPVQNRIDGPYPVFAANGTVGFHSIAKCSGPGVITGRSGTIGKVHFVGGAYWPLNTSLYVTNFHGNNPRWVYYMFQSFGLERFSQGAGVPTLNRNLIHGEPVRVPQLHEQNRIVAILDQADALCTKRRETLAQLDKLAQVIFVEMFGDPFRPKYHWEDEQLSSVCLEINDCPHSTPEWTEQGVVCLRTSNLTQGGWDWSDKRFVSEETYQKRSSRGYIEPGDIVLSREGTVGIAAIVEDGMMVCMGQRLVQIRVDPMKVTPDYLLQHLLYVLAPARISRMMVGSTAQHLNVKELRMLRTPLPPLALQHLFSSRLSALKTLRTNASLAMEQTQALFAALQHRAFRGEL